MPPWVEHLLAWLSLPEFGLTSVFVVSFISATLIPLGSEPVVFGMVKLRPDLLWQTIAVATVGNVLGGVVDYWMGRGAEWMLDSPLKRGAHASSVPTTTARPNDPGKWHQRAVRWMERFGPFGCVFAWLPGIGDPLCAVAGWLRLPFWRCVLWMTIGKTLRYVAFTGSLVWML